MGTTTPNISIYIPSAGETNYDAAFAAGMVNIDQHDHSGGPNKGVQIKTPGIADGSVTYIKLATDVFASNTFVPTLTFGGLSTGITYALNGNVGKYWLVGKMIFFNIEIILTSKGSAVGDAKIHGLPFASANDTFNNLCPIQGNITSYPAGTTFLIGEQFAGSVDIGITACGAGNNTSLFDTNFGNSDTVFCSGFYWIV